MGKYDPIYRENSPKTIRKRPNPIRSKTASVAERQSLAQRDSLVTVRQGPARRDSLVAARQACRSTPALSLSADSRVF